MDNLEEKRMLNAKFGETIMDLSVKLIPDQGEPYAHPVRGK